MSLKFLPFVFLGGGIGASLRFVSNVIVSSLSWKLWISTLLVNIIGSVILISLYKNSITLRPGWEQFVKAGILGGLTTFSTFSLEIFQTSSKGFISESLGILILNVFFGVVIWVWVFR